VQADEERDGLHVRLGELQLAHPPARQASPGHVVVVERDAAAGHDVLRLRLADVVQQRREAQQEVGAVLLERDRVAQHLQ